MRGSSRRALAVCVLVALGGCYGAVDHAMWRASNTAADTAGRRVGESIGNSLAAQYTPALANLYMQFLFAAAFNAGGYQVTEKPYKPGEWTRWIIPGQGKDKTDATLERAFLFKEGANEWWKAKWVLDTKDPANSTLIVEALFDAKDYRLLRMRAKMPNEQQGKEVPVTDQTYYVPPQRLTKESIAGAEKARPSVTVPAGTFATRQIQYGDAGGGTIDWYLTDKVPGGCVKTVHTTAKGESDASTGDPKAWQLLLANYGAGAKSELGIAPGTASR